MDNTISKIKPNKKNKVGGRTRSVLTVLSTGFFALLSCLVAMPLVIGFTASMRPGSEMMAQGLHLNLNFKEWMLDNYLYLLSGNEDSCKFFNWFKNSFVLTLISVIGTLVLCYFIAYGLSMYNFKLKNVLFFIVIATMMVPFEILMLPLYQEIIKFGLIDTTLGVVLPGLCGASTIFFFKQYMSSLPKELLDAGRIDGATEYGICLRIMLPITKPAFAAMAILTSMGAWNNLLWPMLIYKDAQKFTLPIGLNTLLTPYGNNYDVLIAGSMFSLIPVFIVFILFQKYFVEGMTAGAVKG
ncbi:carbohydrate ABC transporter permease [Lachnobacterium bovis]|uniref:Arabinosaccharide transport system permease protein n=1 Tax=Lachnobacterium bovis DSM 14045 TaxID=1122142 RepID=A0A1H3J7I2_9FIRM|nr:carbohydrate ABC transporter permease [Lachnobacterium bovis]MBQ1802369.1 carbohydrate ABC transporter permease [Lachnobacterium sp.]SDY35378.1 arabinosaccharide transport system permease protein [Lachnobacterium bovis DSM 14045]